MDFGSIFNFGVTRELTAGATVRRWGAGDDIFLEGQHADELVGIILGRVKLWRTQRAGEASTLLVLGRGELVGSIAVAQGSPHITSAAAMTDVQAICWNASVFRAQLRRSETLPREFLRLVGHRANQLVDRLEDMSLLPVDKRLARAVFRLIGECGDHDDDLAVRLDVRQQDLADMALTTVPTVSRILAGWRGEGIVATKRSLIVVPHLSRLAMVADLHLD